MNEKTCREIVKERSGKHCEMCTMRAAQMHHRKNRSQGGKWTPANILHLCADCHHAVTVNPHWACGRGLSVKSWQEPFNEPVVRWGKWVLLGDNGDVQEIPDPDREVA